MSFQYDLAVIGAGPGGYVAAIRAAQLGLSTCIIEKEPMLGGTCARIGCIPSKALLEATEHFAHAKHGFAEFGIELTSEPRMNVTAMMARKDEVVRLNTMGVAALMKKNKIAVLKGTASFKDAHTIAVAPATGEPSNDISAANIIIATGSVPISLSHLPLNGTSIITSDQAVGLAQVPKHLMIVGGGVIGLELGSVYARLGAKVTVFEFLDSLIPTMDRELGKALQKALTGQGFAFKLSTKVTGVEQGKKGELTVAYETTAGEKATEKGDVLLVCVGRKAYTEGLNLAAAGLATDERGRVPVDASLRTRVPHVYAIGDAIHGPMLAHKAEEDGVAVAETIAGQHGHVNYAIIPGVVYTNPEVAAVGRTEEELKQAGVAYKKGSFPFKANGRARAAGSTDGFVKVLADAQTDEILGVHAIGPCVSEIIAEAVVAMEYRASAEDIGRIVHAHPTLSEAFKEAALTASAKRPIHM